MTDLERLKAYDDELSKVMPPDFKDWWQGSKNEWPEIAAAVIVSLRQREEMAWQQVEFVYEEMERIK
jgi:cephalosporin-C deacetylase-like acetyl esterase